MEEQVLIFRPGMKVTIQNVNGKGDAFTGFLDSIVIFSEGRELTYEPQAGEMYTLTLEAIQKPRERGYSQKAPAKPRR